ncbi:hypothetical protein AB0H58_32545 [Nocardia neocaledoniensis]|uniref:hypothetical protein n=1 Tax=Nocardia neocaledoniensis TaxID=236511 RepID=UPI003404DEBA
MTMTEPDPLDLDTAARAAVAALAADPGIPSHLTTNGAQLMWHIDHAYLDALPVADRPKRVWAAMTELTGHGIAWTHPEIGGAHRILDAGGVLVLAWDTEDEPDS